LSDKARLAALCLQLKRLVLWMLMSPLLLQM